MRAPLLAVGDGALGSGPRCWSSSRRPPSSAAGSTSWWRILALCPRQGPITERQKQTTADGLVRLCLDGLRYLAALVPHAGAG